jgi:YD repeat-containing protein
MPHIKAHLLRFFRDIDAVKGRKEGKVWAVPADHKNPDGIRYRLAYIPAGHKSPVILYDNHHPKGHHKHINGQEVPYEYRSFEDLLKDFRRDIEAFNEDARN